MGVIYFTNNAATGSGSLAQAIVKATSGDTIRPDESVFERGAIIEIVLASALNVNKNLTFDASPFRVRLDGGELLRCAVVATGVDAMFVNFDFYRGKNASSGGGINAPGASLTLTRCGVYGCSGRLGGGIYATGGLTLSDSVIAGCCATSGGGGVYVTQNTTLNGVTIAGCVAASSGDSLQIASGSCVAMNSILCGSVFNANLLTATGSVVGVASSSVGFVASPPDDLTADNFDANAWQNWDLRLLDDASDSPSPYRDSGDVDTMSQYDYQGNFRGRETNGVAKCSPGAYETIQADLFWIGGVYASDIPNNLQLLSHDSSAVSYMFRWSNRLSNATGFNVEKSYDKGIVWQYSGNYGASTSGVSTESLTSGKIYGYRVRAYNDDTTTGWATIFFVAGGDVLSVFPVASTFDLASGWARSRFAIATSDVAPTDGDRLFIDVPTAFSSAAPFGASIIVGGSAVSVVLSGGEIETSVGSVVTYSGTATALKLGDWTSATNNASATLPPIQFGVNLKFSGVSVSVVDGVIFASTSAPLLLTATGGGGWADVTAGVTSVTVATASAVNVNVNVVKTNDLVAAFIQYSDDDGATWQTINTTADVDEYSLTVTQGSEVLVRVATSNGWLIDSASTAIFVPVWTVSNGYEMVVGVSNVFEIATGGSNDGLNTYDFNNYGYL